MTELCGKYDGMGQCGKCSRLRSVRCGECVTKMKNASSGGCVVRTQYPRQSLTSSNTHPKGVTGGTDNEVTVVSKTKKMFDALSSPSTKKSSSITSKFGKTYFAGKVGEILI